MKLQRGTDERETSRRSERPRGSECSGNECPVKDFCHGHCGGKAMANIYAMMDSPCESISMHVQISAEGHLILLEPGWDWAPRSCCRQQACRWNLGDQIGIAIALGFVAAGQSSSLWSMGNATAIDEGYNIKDCARSVSCFVRVPHVEGWLTFQPGKRDTKHRTGRLGVSLIPRHVPVPASKLK